MTNLDSILKSRDITLPTKVHLVKAMVFPVVIYCSDHCNKVSHTIFFGFPIHIKVMLTLWSINSIMSRKATHVV